MSQLTTCAVQVILKHFYATEEISIKVKLSNQRKLINVNMMAALTKFTVFFVRSGTLWEKLKSDN